MIAPIDKVRGEGNCVRATERGEEAGTSAARLRTETSYKAGVARRVSTTSRSRSQTTAQVNGELVQRQITFLSGETCIAVMRGGVAPRSKACLKARNGSAQAGPGGAGVSSGRSTEDRTPPITGRTKR
jgi:hypothetical protein